MNSIFCCPICYSSLLQQPHSLQCLQRHTFDIAREGYVNLLVGHKKLPETVGDSADMVAARRRFLERGFYEPLSNVINQMVAEYSAGQKTAVSIADIGCGEGYYIAQLHKSLISNLQSLPFAFSGIDISKTAVRLAAKKYPAVQFAVADTWKKLPYADQTVNVLLNIFAPRNTAEFARIATPHALLVVVIPAANHWGSLRQQLGLLDIEPDKQENLVRQLAPAFALQNVQHLSYPLQLDAAALADLVAMSPNARHIALASLPQTGAQTEASFEILMFRREVVERGA